MIKESWDCIIYLSNQKLLLSCQQLVTVTSCFVYKVIRVLRSIDHLCINPYHRIRVLESIDHLCINPIYRIGLIHKLFIDSCMLKWGVHVSVLNSNCKQSITSLSLLVGTTVVYVLDRLEGKHSSSASFWGRVPIKSIPDTYQRTGFLPRTRLEMNHKILFCNLTLYLIVTPVNTFANRADPDQAALIRAAWSRSTLVAYGNMIGYDPTLMDLTSNFFVLCTNMKVYLYNYS